MELPARFIFHISHSRSTTGEGVEGVGEYMKEGTQWEKGGGGGMCFVYLKSRRGPDIVIVPHHHHPGWPKPNGFVRHNKLPGTTRSDFGGGIFEVTEITQRLTRGNVL